LASNFCFPSFNQASFLIHLLLKQKNKMKKRRILALAVLSMVLGSFAVVLPAKAACYMTRDNYGCDVWDCPDIGCVYWHCDNTPGYGQFCDQ
jgi:hypothetical protein